MRLDTSCIGWKGDTHAFTELIGLHDTDMLRVAAVVCCDGDMAEEGVQQPWKRAWRQTRCQARIGQRRSVERIHILCLRRWGTPWPDPTGEARRGVYVVWKS